MTDEKVEIAAAALRHWETEIDASIRRAAALDGPAGWMAKLMGRFDGDVEAAVAEVQAARVRVADAKARLAAVRAAVEQAQRDVGAQAEAQVQAVVAVEQRLLLLREEGGPLAERLNSLDAQLEEARDQQQRLALLEHASAPLAELIALVWGASLKPAPREKEMTSRDVLLANPVLAALQPEAFLFAAIEKSRNEMAYKPPPAGWEGWVPSCEDWLDACADAGISVDAVAVRSAAVRLDDTPELDRQADRMLPLAKLFDDVLKRRTASDEDVARRIEALLSEREALATRP